jgi:ABC-type dipeptide/oligopeptide/nickel transport system ATPase component
MDQRAAWRRLRHRAARRAVIADEPLSGADVSIGAQILALLTGPQVSSGVGFLLITHDMLAAAVQTVDPFKAPLIAAP